MTGTYTALAGGILLLVLVVAWVRADSASRHLPSALDGWAANQGDSIETCPPEFVSQIFSSQDLEFVSKLNSPELRRHFFLERSAVALLWVQQTTTAIRQVMRHHLEASRLRGDIEVATEAKILLQYAQLRLICGLLFLLIGLAGPQRLQVIALRADQLTQRIAAASREFDSAARRHEMGGA
jgi:hypothetical protein